MTRLALLALLLLVPRVALTQPPTTPIKSPSYKAWCEGAKLLSGLRLTYTYKKEPTAEFVSTHKDKEYTGDGLMVMRGIFQRKEGELRVSRSGESLNRNEVLERFEDNTRVWRYDKQRETLYPAEPDTSESSTEIHGNGVFYHCFQEKKLGSVWPEWKYRPDYPVADIMPPDPAANILTKVGASGNVLDFVSEDNKLLTRYTLDPAQGMMPTRIEYYQIVKEKEGELFLYRYFTVEEYTHTDNGAFLPHKSTVHDFARKREDGSISVDKTHAYEMTAFQVNVQFNPDEFRYTFPEGVHVQNHTVNSSYKVGDKEDNTVTGAPNIHQVPGQAEVGTVEINGVAAGVFAAKYWEDNTLNLVPDMRDPLLAPRQSGVFRNIYAPSAVQTATGWRLFYGAWDGVPTGNDRIYCADTTDFIDFGARRTVIEHGEFIHTCNVNALAKDGGGFEMVVTAYPDAKGDNKPAYFSSPDGEAWNGAAAPCAAKQSDIVRVEGYDKYDDADINGVNVIMRGCGCLHLYFNNYKDFGRVYRATGTDGKTFQFDGTALECPYAVNDVKWFAVADGPRYLMGLHMNGEGLWYALSKDGMKFDKEQPLLTHTGPQDKYIVALGWVVRDNRLLGVLYGAGAVPELNRNRIFARWLQKRVVFTSNDGTRVEPEAALGPDRQILRIPEGIDRAGTLQIFAEDGKTPLGEPIPGTLNPGTVHALTVP